MVDGPRKKKPSPPQDDADEAGRDRRIKLLQPFGEVASGQRQPDAVYERAVDIDRIVDQVERVGRSFLLVGPTGVGKSVVLRQATHRLASRQENAWRFLETSTGMLIAGQVYIGAWQEHIKELISVAQRRNRIGIWLADPAHLFSTGRSTGSTDTIGSFMMPALERGRVLLFGEATPEVHAALVAANPSVARIFDTINLEPQAAEVAAETVRQVASARATRAGDRRGVVLQFAPEAVERCVTLGHAYFPSTSPPAGAIRLVDAVLEDRILGPLLPSGIAADRKRTGIDRKEASAKVVGAGSTAAGSPIAASRVVIPPAAVITALCQLTGAPRALLDDAVALPAADVRRFFESRLVGQAKAIDGVVDLVAMIKAGLVDPARPAGVLLFVGPTGVGKTELARALAEFVFGSTDRLVRLDMSEYARPDGAKVLLGSPDDGKGLLARVRQQPFSVILLDEIEKAHPVVFDLLLQLFDAGRLSTPEGETFNFKQSVIILTSNLGAGEPPPGGFGFVGAEPPSAEDWIRHSVSEFFRPEFVNRLGQIVVFDPLDRADVRKLAQREIGAVLLRSGITRRRLQVDIDRAVVDLLAGVGYDPRYGARPLKRAVERIVLAPLAHVLAETPFTAGTGLIQVLPAGDRVRVVPIRDDRAGRQQELAAVRLVDPFDGTAMKATVETLKRWLCDLGKEVDLTRAEHERSGMAARRSAIVAETAAPGFWDDSSLARAALAELYQAERTSEAVAACVEEAGRIAEETRRSNRATAPAEIARLAGEIERCRRQATILRFAILCDAPLQRADAFVVHDALERQAAEHVRHVAESHAAWARRLGFEVVEVHEEGFGKGGTGKREDKQIVLQINGAAVSGMLAGQDGLHEFLPDAKSASRLVRVTVMPVADAASEPDDGQVEVTVGSEKRPEVRASHRRTGQTVTIRPAAGTADVELRARELLAAEMARQSRLRAGAAPQEVVRRWWLGARPSVRDPRTGVTMSRIKDVLNGDIDRFLLAHLERRAVEGGTATSAGGG